MEKAIYVGLSNQVALQKQLEVVANNLANMNTTGYRAERMVFQEFVDRSQNTKAPDTSYVLDRATYMDERPGGLTQSGNPLDVAINGNGWFAYQTPSGIAYSRDGRLQIDSQNRIVNADGYPILSRDGSPISISSNDNIQNLTIARDGTLAMRGTMIGNLGVFTFDSNQRLQRISGGLFSPGQAKAVPATDVNLAQGMIEQSNVRPVFEITKMMETHRAFEQASKALDSANDLQSNAINRINKSV
jgi:flagellar basal-body rod protein FlgF